MSYQETIRRAHVFLKQALQEAHVAGDHTTADELGYAIAICRSADIMAKGFLAGLPSVPPEQGRAADHGYVYANGRKEL